MTTKIENEILTTAYIVLHIEPSEDTEKDFLPVFWNLEDAREQYPDCEIHTVKVYIENSTLH